MDVAQVYPQSVFNTQHQAMNTFLCRADATNYVYQHQIEAVQAVSAQLQTPDASNIALVVLPTGCGKTGVAVLAAYASNATRVLVVTPSVKISKQIYEAFCVSPLFLEERGIITPMQRSVVCPQGACITNSTAIPLNLGCPLMIVNAHKIGGSSSVRIEDIPSNNYDLVIVDEAHHYPAPTWKTLVDHFPNSRRLFLTATPEYQGRPILEDHPPCYEMSHNDAVLNGVIRNIGFHEIPSIPSDDISTELQKVAIDVRNFLDQHDQQDPEVKHQALVLAQTVDDLNSATSFKMAHDAVCTRPGDTCEVYVGGTPQATLNLFDTQQIRILVIVGKLLEGYDNKHISVLAIVRNVARQSKVLFTQFVGRAVRKVRPQDPVTAMIISHERFNQKDNFEQFDTVTDEDNVDED